MSMKLIGDSWDGYLNAILLPSLEDIPPGPPRYVEVAKLAFYAGAAATFGEMAMCGMDAEKVTELAIMARWDAIAVELREYANILVRIAQEFLVHVN